MANCPVCDADIVLNADVEVTEVISCTDCKSRVVVDSFDAEKHVATLSEAPAVEEDWGE